jgi:RNA polymerase sigma-70 factor, ECF subfamily
VTPVRLDYQSRLRKFPAALFTFSLIWHPVVVMGNLPPTVGKSRSSTEAVYRRDGEKMWRALLAYGGDRAIADDAVSEAFAQLLRRGDEVRSPELWVWRAAFRIAAGELQHRRRFEQLVDDRGRNDPEPACSVLDALRGLSSQQRAIVVLRDYIGHSTRQTAEIVGATEASVRVQLSRARRSLRKELSQ